MLIFLITTIIGCSQTEKESSLKDAYKDKFSIGAALNKDQIMGKDSAATLIVEEYFNSITAENVMKWEKIHPKSDTFDFVAADKFVELGEKNNMYIVGHVLVWHAQTPKWVFEDEEGNPATCELLLERMENHIKTVVGRYKGRVNCWDVVNEAIGDTGEKRKNQWYNIIGEDYIQKAFEIAHEVDPEAHLIYNDYSIPMPKKLEGVLKMAKGLQEKGVKIDGIGLQGHYLLDFPKLEDLEKTIVEIANLGLKVHITEIELTVLPWPGKVVSADISLNFEMKKKYDLYPDGMPDSVETAFNNRYKDFFNLFLKYSDNIERVTFWGVTDQQSWRNYWPIRGRTDYPLLFDREYKEKSVVQELINLTKE
ncbi:endo-1,4-beta-xylanase [Bacteroidota bacterium]